MRYGMVINLKKCVGCYACTVACQIENNLPVGFKYCKVNHVGPIGKFPNLLSYSIPLACMHCQDAPCVTACPTGASHIKKDDGFVVAVDEKKCIGCLFCMVVCPYDARKVSPESKTVEKCTFCIDRLKDGLVTRCTETCQLKARIVGDLDDPHSEVMQLIRKHNAKPLQDELGTHPAVYYII
jgi:Fe-S-cluster-containing dehydrogenase component